MSITSAVRHGLTWVQPSHHPEFTWVGYAMQMSHTFCWYLKHKHYHKTCFRWAFSLIKPSVKLRSKQLLALKHTAHSGNVQMWDFRFGTLWVWMDAVPLFIILYNAYIGSVVILIKNTNHFCTAKSWIISIIYTS